MKNLKFWFECLRAYALPMSFMAWLIPFCCGVKESGNVFYGIAALIGIVLVHLGANLFDDVIDYKSFLKSKETNHALNLQKGKCKFFQDGTITVKKALTVCVALFGIAGLIGLSFVCLYKLPILVLMAVTGVLCLLYPKSGYYGLSEIIIGTIYSPLLFTGVYYVMTGGYSKSLLWISLSFALVTLTLLYTDFYMDFNTDRAGSKRTIPVLSGSKRNAYYIFIFIICIIYLVIILGVLFNILSVTLLTVILSVPSAKRAVENLRNYLDKEIGAEGEFLQIMNDVQKFIAAYTILCSIGVITA